MARTAKIRKRMAVRGGRTRWSRSRLRTRISTRTTSAPRTLRARTTRKNRRCRSSCPRSPRTRISQHNTLAQRICRRSTLSPRSSPKHSKDNREGRCTTVRRTTAARPPRPRPRRSTPFHPFSSSTNNNTSPSRKTRLSTAAYTATPAAHMLSKDTTRNRVMDSSGSGIPVGWPGGWDSSCPGALGQHAYRRSVRVLRLPARDVQHVLLAPALALSQALVSLDLLFIHLHLHFHLRAEYNNGIVGGGIGEEYAGFQGFGADVYGYHGFNGAVHGWSTGRMHLLPRVHRARPERGPVRRVRIVPRVQRWVRWACSCRTTLISRRFSRSSSGSRPRRPPIFERAETRCRRRRRASCMSRRTSTVGLGNTRSITWMEGTWVWAGWAEG
ncbi:hypothetical protein BDN71DRAFT_752680 [Pleurotus eryngii]|uniref:Uncharacterized protein n=1 Tax=Pleurotus eryngii TaxID=5323 RepID=A0A9P5ZY72_PLEER|nr:hypothetical protein BDN71DRAFT_752680 [Pleurotus eryngii]